MYEVIVLGASFAALGIAESLGDKCLILERGLRAGSEFFDALRFTEAEAELCSALRNCSVLFGTDVVSVEKTDHGYACRVFNARGFTTYYAKRVIDTRCREGQCLSKTYNLLITSDTKPSFEGVHAEKASGENRFLLCCDVPLSCTYAEARGLLLPLITELSASQRLILSANAFDYRVKADYPKTEDGILYLPSKCYESPDLATEAGRRAVKEVLK